MTVKKPTSQEMAEICTTLGMKMSSQEIESFLEQMGGAVAAYNALDGMGDELPQVTYPRTPGYRPSGEENKYNAWYHKTTVKGASTGKLEGKKIALKDNVMLAGVPMMNGASTLEGY